MRRSYRGGWRVSSRDMIERFAQLPSALRSASRTVRLGDAGVPALLAHPDWRTPAPVVVWMHGRTVDKTLDPGRYLRWIRSGIAACALDLPGHGERFEEGMHSPRRTLHVVDQMIGEIDGVVAALGAAEFGGVFDLDRMGIGGMSAGGMATLRRCCDAHPFRAIAVESTVGDFSVMPYREYYDDMLIARLDPIRNLSEWRCAPILALHSKRDEWAPVEGMRRFMGAVEGRCAGAGDGASAEGARAGRPCRSYCEVSEDEIVRFVTWEETGAPNEHAGFGRVANDAKNIQLEFYKKWLA